MTSRRESRAPRESALAQPTQPLRLVAAALAGSSVRGCKRPLHPLRLVVAKSVRGIPHDTDVRLCLQQNAQAIRTTGVIIRQNDSRRHRLSDAMPSLIQRGSETNRPCGCLHAETRRKRLTPTVSGVGAPSFEQSERSFASTRSIRKRRPQYRPPQAQPLQVLHSSFCSSICFCPGCTDIPTKPYSDGGVSLGCGK